MANHRIERRNRINYTVLLDQHSPSVGRVGNKINTFLIKCPMWSIVCGIASISRPTFRRCRPYNNHNNHQVPQPMIEWHTQSIRAHATSDMLHAHPDISLAICHAIAKNSLPHRNWCGCANVFPFLLFCLLSSPRWHISSLLECRQQNSTSNDK